VSGATASAAPRRATIGFMWRHPARWIALGFGSGLSPAAPGTVGTLWAWMGADGTLVVSLFTQIVAEWHHSGSPGPATVQHTGHALRELHKLAVAEKFTSIALPRLATGVGRLAWDEVSPLIKQHLDALAIPVLVYATYHAGQQANEGL
jgi:O-acetyl-ADP-ribose deacetylase (regulator of RNase III)